MTPWRLSSDFSFKTIQPKCGGQLVVRELLLTIKLNQCRFLGNLIQVDKLPAKLHFQSVRQLERNGHGHFSPR